MSGTSMLMEFGGLVDVESISQWKTMEWNDVAKAMLDVLEGDNGPQLLKLTFDILADEDCREWFDKTVFYNLTLASLPLLLAVKDYNGDIGKAVSSDPTLITNIAALFVFVADVTLKFTA